MSWLVARTSSSLDCLGAVDLNPRVQVIKVNGSLPLHPVLPDNCKKAAASRLAVKKNPPRGRALFIDQRFQAAFASRTASTLADARVSSIRSTAATSRVRRSSAAS